MRYYHIDHVVTVPNDVDMDTLLDALIDWVESRGWATGGNVAEVDEGGRWKGVLGVLGEEAKP